MNQTIYLIGLNHRSAGVEIREKFALAEAGAKDIGLISDTSPVVEAMILSTCNRVEIIAVVPAGTGADCIIEAWARACGSQAEVLWPCLYIYENVQAVEHLFTVGASLDSMVVGEPQILGQLKEAYRKAVKHGTAKVIINRMLHKAFSVAKRVRSETGIASAAVSISYAAVELAKKIFGDMENHTAMLIGAGEMAELAAMNLISAGIKNIIVVNRTLERAKDLACRMQGEAASFDDLPSLLSLADIVISSTGASDTILCAADMQPVLKKRRNEPMFFIDIAVPRDIDPDVNTLDNVYLYDIDDLNEVVEENLNQRKSEATKARFIVEEETMAFVQWLRSLALQPTIVDLLNYGENIARRELAKTIKRLGPGQSEETEKALLALTRSLVQKLYHEPIVYLKRRKAEEEKAEYLIGLTRRMFNLDNETVPEDAHADRKNLCPKKEK